MKRLPLAAIAVIAAAASAHAADLAPRPYTKVPQAVAVESWTGFYLGAELGGRWSDATWTSTALEDPISAFENAFRLPQDNPAGFGASTPRAGGYAGYNWQFAPTWVAGLEGDIAWGHASKTLAGIPGTLFPGATPADIATDSATVTEGWDAGIRGRLGFLVTPNVMLFGSGGVAFQDVSVTANCSIHGAWCILDRSESFSKVKTGWTAGGGVEGRLASNWLARVEYRYADFGQVSHEFYPQTVDAVFMNQSMKTHTVSVGVAYQFGSPAVAR